MTIVKHELRQRRTSFWIWTGAIGFLLAVCVFLFPEMKGEMGGVGISSTVESICRISRARFAP